jgi:glutathione S-transferase
MMSGWIVLVTVAALLLYVYMGVAVSQARVKHNIPAPTMTGNPEFERAVRVQMNTLEWLPVFIAALWMCASFWDARIVALVGVAWVVGRALYMQSYSKGENRSLGFSIQGLTVLALTIGAVVGAIMQLVGGGA